MKESFIILCLATVALWVGGCASTPGKPASTTTSAVRKSPAPGDVIHGKVRLADLVLLSEGIDTPPTTLKRFLPYPHALMKQQIGGAAVVEFSVLADGKVSDVQLISCSRTEFGSAALSAIRSTTYTAGSHQGVKTTARMRADFTYETSWGPAPDLPASAGMMMKIMQARRAAEQGRVYNQEADYSNALAAYDYALQLTPENGSYLNNRGNVKERMNDLIGAKADYEAAAKHQPESATPRINVAHCKLLLGDLSGAEADCRRALELDPKLPYIYNVLGQLNLSRGNLQGALAEFDKGIALYPKSVDMLRRRSEVKRTLGDIPGAEADLALSKQYDQERLTKPDSA